MAKAAIAQCCHSSLDSSVPTILLPQDRVPSTPSTLLSFIVFMIYLSCEKDENKQKEAGLAHFKKKMNKVQENHFSPLRARRNRALTFRPKIRPSRLPA